MSSVICNKTRKLHSQLQILVIMVLTGLTLGLANVEIISFFEKTIGHLLQITPSET